MNYFQISETEFRTLELLRDQHDLGTGLLCLADVDLQYITSTSLLAFLDARGKELSNVLNAVEMRYDLQLEQDRLSAEQAPAIREAAQLQITPELLVGLMDAASGTVTDSDALLGLWDKLYEAGVAHRPYMELSQHFLHILKGRGLELRTEFIGSNVTREFIACMPHRAAPAKAGASKPRKREKLAASA